VQRFVLEKYR